MFGGAVQFDDGCEQALGIVHIRAVPIHAVYDPLRNSPDASQNDRSLARHGLKNRARPSFNARREQVNVEGRVQSRKVGIANKPCSADRNTQRFQIPNLFFPSRSAHDEMKIGDDGRGFARHLKKHICAFSSVIGIAPFISKKADYESAGGILNRVRCTLRWRKNSG